MHDTGRFELDGNAVNNPALAGDDWDNVCHQVLGSDCSTRPTNTDDHAVAWAAEPNPNSSIFTGGGSKDPQDLDQWAWKDGRRAAGQGQPAAWLRGALLAAADRPPARLSGRTRHDLRVLFFGSDRFDNSGDAVQGFWFFQDKVTLGQHQVGGGTGFNGVHKTATCWSSATSATAATTSTITVYKWDPPARSEQPEPASARPEPAAAAARRRQLRRATDGSSAASSTRATGYRPRRGPSPDKSGNNTFLQGEFFEGGVNLSTLGLGGRVLLERGLRDAVVDVDDGDAEGLRPRAVRELHGDDDHRRRRNNGTGRARDADHGHGHDRRQAIRSSRRRVQDDR